LLDCLTTGLLGCCFSAFILDEAFSISRRSEDETEDMDDVEELEEEDEDEDEEDEDEEADDGGVRLIEEDFLPEPLVCCGLVDGTLVAA
jgi:hypothetical protein